MRIVGFIILILYSSFNICVADIPAIERKKEEVVRLYDSGKYVEAINALKQINLSKDNAFIIWLNIAMIEFENEDLKQAQTSITKAGQFAPKKNTTYKNLLNICYKIIKKEKASAEFISSALLFQTSDPLEKLIIWKLLYEKLYFSNSIKTEELQQLKQVPKNTLRYAKILSLESVHNFNKNQIINSIDNLLESLSILENLQIQDKNYYKNIKALFYRIPIDYAKQKNEALSKYENSPYVQKNLGLKVALDFYKARYYQTIDDFNLSYIYIKEAYDNAKDDNIIISFLAYVCKRKEDYSLALLYYKKLIDSNSYDIEDIAGAGECAYFLGNEKLCNLYTLKIIHEVKYKKLKLYDYPWVIHYLKLTKQEDFIPEIEKNLLKNYYNKKIKDLDLSYTFCEIGTYFWHKKKYQKALNSYQQSIISTLPHENNTDIYADLNYSNCISLQSLIIDLNNKGEAFYQLSKTRKNKNEEIRDLKHCFKNLNLSIEQIYNYKMQLSSEEQMYLFSDLKSSKYPNIIKVCLELYNLTGDTYYQSEAFKFAEQGKATVMLSMLRGRNGSKIGMIPSEYKKLEDSINLQISLLNQRLSAIKEDSPSKFSINSQIDVLANKRADLEKMYQKKYPKYYNLKYSSNVTQANYIQQSLNDKECIVEFLLNRNFLISYYLDKKSLIVKTDTLKNLDLANLADQFYNQVNHYDPSGYKPDSINQFITRASTLYNILLKPFENNFKDKTIIIVADNSLSKIPFEALLTSHPGKTNSYRNLPYLIRKNSVYYAPSVTFLNELRQRPVLQKKAKLLAVAPIYPSLKLNDTITRTLLAVRADTSIFGSLPNARKEIMFANQIAGGKLLAEKDATEGRFKKIAGEYDIIHLATHGILNIKASLQSNLLFADSNTGEDGFLHAYEIYNLNQTSQLVILSACNTGAGKNYGGEGVISVGRGFLSSGSRSVIMTLWPVNDHSSYELIKGFYKELKNKTSISDALRNSKLSYLSQTDNLHSHPFFWTGYVIYGDASIKLSIQNNNVLYLVLTIVGMVILVLLFWKFNAVASKARMLWPYKKNEC